MKRRILLFCLATLLCVAAVVVWKYRATIFRNGDVSELYLRYADTEGINATFIKDFHVNDTVYVDVTLLQATDSAGWETLVQGFSIRNAVEEELAALEKGKDIISVRKLQSYPNGETDILAISRLNLSVFIFRSTNKTEETSVLHYNFLKQQKNEKDFQNSRTTFSAEHHPN